MATTLRQRYRPERNNTATEDRALSLESFKQLQEQASPVFVTIANVMEKIEPIFDTVYTNLLAVWGALQPYHPEDLFVALYGFFLVFFGGVFMTLVASAEAAHQFGWDRIKDSLMSLSSEWAKARVAFEHDNRLDENRDGIADVQVLDSKQLAARRLMVLTKSVDPSKVSMALEGLTIATVAVLATLRVRFAKAITLGTAIGSALDKLLSPFTTKILQFSLPDAYEKWIPVINKYGFRYLGVSVSWILMRIITSVFAAVRGSELFILGVIAYLERHGYVRHDLFKEGSPAVVGAWSIVTMLGVYWQISSGFRLPFPLNLLLLPFTIAEQVVVFAVGTSAR